MPRYVKPMEPERRGKLEKVLSREQYAPRVPPAASPVQKFGAPSKPRPDTRQGPNVVSEYFVQKNCRERARQFWKKPWGRYKVDLPLPSYLRDFKYADNELLRPHFAHYRRNVGVSRDADTSLEMLRSLSAPPYPSVRADETNIIGNYEVTKDRDNSRLPMIKLPKRVPLENPVAMDKLRRQEFSVDSKAHTLDNTKKRRKKASPEKMGLFLDELTEAYALCSAHEQLAEEMSNLQKKTTKFASGKGLDLKLPPFASSHNALDTLQTILHKSQLSKTKS